MLSPLIYIKVVEKLPVQTKWQFANNDFGQSVIKAP